MTETKKKPGRLGRIAAVAAALLLLICGAAGYRAYRINYAVASTVSLDVNPSIEIQVNQKDTVLNVIALNEDGKIVIGDMDFKGAGLDVTVNALIGSMLRNGYLSELANSILISVNSDDPAKSAELQTRLTEEINALLQTDTFSGAVLSQTVSSDAALQQIADSYGITPGKAQLIQQLIDQNPLHTFEELVPLSINELNLLRGSTLSDSVNSVGTASDKAYIGEEKAKELALAHAGVTAEAIYHYEFEMDYEHGVMVYEIEFSCGGDEYSYDIDASTGAIVKYEKERDGDKYHQPSGETGNSSEWNRETSSSGDVSNPSPSGITEAGAKEIALAHAGVSADMIINYKCKLDNDDGMQVYEIEFSCDGYEYSYDIDASTGAIVKYEKERDDDRHHQSSQLPSDSPSASGGDNVSGITEETAKATALAHAGLTADSISRYECKLDYEDHVLVYEIEFKSGGYEYSYDIDAATGTILKFEKERDD